MGRKHGKKKDTSATKSLALYGRRDVPMDSILLGHLQEVVTLTWSGDKRLTDDGRPFQLSGILEIHPSGVPGAFNLAIKKAASAGGQSVDSYHLVEFDGAEICDVITPIPQQLYDGLLGRARENMSGKMATPAPGDGGEPFVKLA